MRIMVGEVENYNENDENPYINKYADL